MLANGYQAYQNNSIMTASGPELTLMLYNGAIKFCNLAIEALQNKNIQKAHENIIKAENIIDELRITLNKSYPIAKDMDEMYKYISNVLIRANFTKDIKLIQEAIYFIKEYRDAWKEAMAAR